MTGVQTCALPIFIFANGTVYWYMLDPDEHRPREERAQQRWDTVDFRHHQYTPALARIGTVSVIQIAVCILIAMGLNMTRTEWVIDNTLIRLLICLISTSAILSEIPGISTYLHWSDSLMSNLP